MKSIKTHFGVIFSLVALLFSVQFGIFMSNLTKSYERSIQNEYNIVLVSKTSLSLQNAQKAVPKISSISEISTAGITVRLCHAGTGDAFDALNRSRHEHH